HTRFSRDWSSDVCSSDLTGPFLMSVAAGLAEAGVEVVAVCDINALARWAATPWRAAQEPGKLLEGVEYARTFLTKRIPFRMRTRSEERRVGKEWRARRAR